MEPPFGDRSEGYLYIGSPFGDRNEGVCLINLCDLKVIVGDVKSN